MGIVWTYYAGKLANGKQTTINGFKVQGQIFKRKPAKNIFAFIFTGGHHFISVVICSGNFYRLHYFIFDFQKQINMLFTAQVKVMPLKDLLDPQGKAVLGGLENLGVTSVSDVRIGKNIDLQIEAATKEEAIEIASVAAKKLLANPVMEMFEITVN